MDFNISEIDFNEENEFFNNLQSSCCSTSTQNSSSSNKESVSPSKGLISEKTLSQTSGKRLNSFSTFSPELAVKRRFPGPAGLLPDERISDCDMVFSQNTTSAFQEVPWIEMSKDFQIGETYLFNKFNIAWIKQQSNVNRLLDEKSPFLAAVIQSIDVSDGRSRKVVNVSLMDLTGTIQGTILDSLYEAYKSELKIGSVIILKQFGVLSCNCENCDNFHITITPNNLGMIYTDNAMKKVLSDVSVTEVMREYNLAKERIENKNNKLCDKKHKQYSFTNNYYNKYNTSVSKSIEFNTPKNKYNFKVTENISKSSSLKNEQEDISKSVNLDISTDTIKTKHNISDTELWKSVLEDIDVDCLFGDF